MVGMRIVGVQKNGSFELGFGTHPVPVIAEVTITKRGVRLCQIWLKMQRPMGSCFALFQSDRGLQNARLPRT